MPYRRIRTKPVRRHKKRSILILIPILAAAGVLFALIYSLLDPRLYGKVIQDSLGAAIGREVAIGRAKISLLGGLGIAFEDVRVKDRSKTFDLFQAKTLIVKVKTWPLIKREVRWQRIILDQPVFRLVRNKEGRFNLFDIPLTQEDLKDTHQKMLQTLLTLFGGSFTVRGGTISFEDETLNHPPLTTEIRSLDFEISEVSYQKPFPFRLSGRVHQVRGEGYFSLAGKILNIPETLDLSQGRVEAEMKMRGIDLSGLWSYLKPLLPMKTVSGMLDLEGRYQGDFSGVFKSSARIKIKDPLFDYPQVFASVLTPRWANIGFDFDYDSKNLRVSLISVEMPEIWVKGKGRIYGIGSEGMGLEAEAESGPFDLAAGKKLIPYRIITPEVSDALFRSEGSGPVQIVSVKLSGKMPEIYHCDQPRYAHTLSVALKLNGARVKLPWNLPPFDDLRGPLLFKEGHLNLQEVKARIFQSTLENIKGAFRNVLFTSTLQFQCDGKFDVADLPALAKTDLFSHEVSEALSSINVLSGKADYRLSAKGVLAPPYHFEHRSSYLLSRTRFTHRQIPFPVLIAEGKIDLSNDVLDFSGARVEFGHSSLLMNGSWRHGEKPPLFDITAKGRTDLKDLLILCRTPLFPEEIRAKTKEMEGLSGTGEISFKGKNTPKDSRLSYEVEFLPREVSLSQKRIPFPLVSREGAFTFSNLGVGFSNAKIQFLNSFVFLDGSVKEGQARLLARGSVNLKQLSSLLRSTFFPDQIRAPVEEIQELNGEADVRLRWLGGTGDWIDSLREGQVRLRGVSFLHRKIPLPLSQGEGSLIFTPEWLRFENLKGKLGDTQVILSGASLRSMPSPSSPGSEKAPAGLSRLSFQISSPLLDLDLLFPKKGEGPSFEKVRDGLSHWDIEGKVEADQVRYSEHLYQGLKVEMKTVDGRLLLSTVHLKAAGGDLWGEGWVEPSDKGVRFEIKPRISNMEAKTFFRTLFQMRDEERILMTGRVHIDKVGLQGEGGNLQEMKGSLNGGLRLEIENGVIERFNLLAKIFSILNVSQLFKGRFPDLKTRGLPFHRITATFQFKEGIASTEDFLVDSDAVRITLVGKVDLRKNLIDARVGVHPLVTIDAVLSNVPIAGYILTGKDKAFLSFVYEVKGDRDDPKIEAIPVKSMGEGLFGILKRLLETPLRPFQKIP
jgi:uncharacterized protein involved in outer membrane biogenesis